MSAYTRNRENQFSHCYYEKASPFTYHNGGYGTDFTKNETRRIRSNKDRWHVIKLFTPSINETERKFKTLSDKWKDETGFYSTTQQKVYNKNYLSIIGMGKDVLPYILKDLKNGGTWHWHTALSVIADDNDSPVELGEMSNPKMIKEAWIKWGESQNLI